MLPYGEDAPLGQIGQPPIAQPLVGQQPPIAQPVVGQQPPIAQPFVGQQPPIAQPVVGQQPPSQMQMATPLTVGGAPARTGDVMKQAMSILNLQPAVKVQQIRRLRDAFSCSFNNMYVVKDASGRDVFFVQEDSTCIEKNCCSGECKAWRMNVNLLGPQGYVQGQENQGTPFMHLERPFTCTFCCLNRPEVFITELPSNTQLGTLTDPCACCKLNTTISDPGSMNPSLKIEAPICQPGIFCPWPCCDCKVDFPVFDANSNAQVASLTKVWMMGDVCPLCFKEWSTFDLSFDSRASLTPLMKMHLMSTALFVQMAWFDKRNQNNN